MDVFLDWLEFIVLLEPILRSHYLLRKCFEDGTFVRGNSEAVSNRWLPSAFPKHLDDLLIPLDNWYSERTNIPTIF